jgi:hypothetical protein
MKHKVRLFIIVRSLLFLLAGFSIPMMVQAQHAVTASGGTSTGSGGTVTYSIGQEFCNISTSANVSVSEGVQQPYEISVIIGIGVLNIDLEIKAYPNPASTILRLIVKSEKLENFTFQLVDIKGRIVDTGNITDTETIIAVDKLVPAAYLLRVSERNKEIKTFRIIKN